MEIEKQVVSLELARKMKDLGFEQESLFYWFPFGGGVHEWQLTERLFSKEDLKGWKFYEKNDKDFVFYSAYTVAELLKIIYDMTGMLPCIHDRDLKPEKIADYLAEIACNIKEE